LLELVVVSRTKHDVSTIALCPESLKHNKTKLSYQKGKTNLDFTEASASEWHWHQLGHMQVCTLLQTDNHASTSPLSFYRPDALPAAQPTMSKHSAVFDVLVLTGCTSVTDWRKLRTSCYSNGSDQTHRRRHTDGSVIFAM